MINPLGGNIPIHKDNPHHARPQEKKPLAGIEDKAAEVTLNERHISPATYSKPKASANTAEVQSLWRQAEDAYAPLKALVDVLISRQGKCSNVCSGKFDISPGDIEKAQQLISEEGELGVDKTAERIVAFAKAISGEDKSRLGEIRAAIEQGFREAEKVLGGLPDICQRTYDEVMKRLDEWELSD